MSNVNSVKNFIKLNDIDNIIKEKTDKKYKFEKIYDIFYKMKNDDINKCYYLKEKIPRGENTLFFKDKNFNNNFNIVFNFQGKHLILQATPDMLFAEVVLEFFNRLNLPHDGKFKIYYNSTEIRMDSYKTLSELGIQNLSNFEVDLN